MCVRAPFHRRPRRLHRTCIAHVVLGYPSVTQRNTTCFVCAAARYTGVFGCPALGPHLGAASSRSRLRASEMLGRAPGMRGTNIMSTTGVSNRFNMPPNATRVEKSPERAFWWKPSQGSTDGVGQPQPNVKYAGNGSVKHHSGGAQGKDTNHLGGPTDNAARPPPAPRADVKDQQQPAGNKAGGNRQ